VRLDPDRIAEFRLPLPGLPLLGKSSGLQLFEAALALSELADACRDQQKFLTNLAEALRQKNKGPALEIERKSNSGE
jgi:hypothetical protein